MYRNVVNLMVHAAGKKFFPKEIVGELHCVFQYEFVYS